MSPGSGHLSALHDTIKSLRPFLISGLNKLPEPKFKSSGILEAAIPSAPLGTAFGSN